MSGRGEQLKERDELDESIDISIGQTLYTDDGTSIGTIRGIEEGGVFLSIRDGVESLSVEHARSGHAFGEAELVWRCTVCGEMGHIQDGLPDGCPGCASDREQLMYWTED